VIVRLKRRWKSGIGKGAGWNGEEVTLTITLVIDSDSAYGAEAVSAAHPAIANPDELSRASIDGDSVCSKSRIKAECAACASFAGQAMAH
jgi:hypothetical protein